MDEVRIILPAVSDDKVSSDLRYLTEVLDGLGADRAQGLLGGEYGYGCEYENDVFEMFPYWWGDCTCGFEDAEIAWANENPHAPSCWQERYNAEWERLDALKLDYDRRSGLLDEWTVKNGWDGRPGVAAYCDCGTDAKWRTWREAHDHDPRCPEVRPNFKCGDVEVRWYKYIGRGMTVNRDVSRDEWRALFARCFDSLGSES